MCVAVPMKVVEIRGSEIVGEIDGVRRDASLMLLDEPISCGDYVIVHAGFVISRLDEREAVETLELMRSVFSAEDMA